MSVASKFAHAAFALVEILIVVAAIALHLVIICIVLALPILGRIKTAPPAQPVKFASILPSLKAPAPKLHGI
jgi:cytochrome b561